MNGRSGEVNEIIRKTEEKKKYIYNHYKEDKNKHIQTKTIKKITRKIIKEPDNIKRGGDTKKTRRKQGEGEREDEHENTSHQKAMKGKRQENMTYNSEGGGQAARHVANDK